MNPDDVQQNNNQEAPAQRPFITPMNTNGSVIPTPWWMTVYGADLTIEQGGRTRLLPVGTVINFFVEKNGTRVWCGHGEIILSDSPKFRTLLLHTPIYRDDWSSDVLEGPVEGDKVGVVIGSRNQLGSTVPVIPIGTDGKERELIYQTNVFDDGRYGIRLTGFRFARLRGDIDGDGEITGVDLQRLVSAIVGKQDIPIESTVYYDVNGDGKVDMADVEYLVNYLHRGGPAPERVE